MIKSILLVVVFFVASIGFSQSSHDSRLLEKYSEAELTELKKSESEEYNILVNALERGISIGEIPNQKGKKVQFVGELDIDLTQEHTFISLGLELNEKKHQYYKITGTNKYLVVYPKRLLK